MGKDEISIPFAVVRPSSAAAAVAAKSVRGASDPRGVLVRNPSAGSTAESAAAVVRLYITCASVSRRKPDRRIMHSFSILRIVFSNPFADFVRDHQCTASYIHVV